MFTQQGVFDADGIRREHPDSFTDDATDFVEQNFAEFRDTTTEYYHLGMKNRNDVGRCDPEVLARADQGFADAVIPRFRSNQHFARRNPRGVSFDLTVELRSQSCEHQADSFCGYRRAACQGFQATSIATAASRAISDDRLVSQFTRRPQ